MKARLSAGHIDSAIYVAALVRGGLFLREGRLRGLIPQRGWRSAAGPASRGEPHEGPRT